MSALLSFVIGNMAVSAHLRLAMARQVRFLREIAAVAVARRTAADGVRHVGAERDAAQAVGGDRLLLHVDRVAVEVVRADVNGARRAGRADAVAGHVAVAGQHEHVVAQGLEVVGDVVARHVALVVQGGHLLVRLLRQMAAEAARVPRRMAGDAAHVLIAVARPCRTSPPGMSPQTNSLLRASLKRTVLARCAACVVAWMAGRYDILDLHQFPAQVLVDHRVLDEHLAAALEAALAERSAQWRQITAGRLGALRVRSCAASRIS